jgi:flagellin
MLDTAITGASSELAQYGAFTNRLEFAINNLTGISLSADESRSRIEDADYAIETSNLSRQQIISQAATAILAQANQSTQTVLALLQ